MGDEEEVRRGSATRLTTMNDIATRTPDSAKNRIRLRDVIDSDIPIFFEHQCDPVATQMAAFPPRAWDAFVSHWTKIRSDQTVTTKTVLFDEQVAGNIGSWEGDGKRLVGYWIGRNYWGRGVATQALVELLKVVQDRPLHAHVAKHNLASIRILEKCGFAISDEDTASVDAPDDGVEEVVLKLGTNNRDPE
jgi:RimJ/RimL family protein N-acetyltransferase